MNIRAKVLRNVENTLVWLGEAAKIKMQAFLYNVTQRNSEMIAVYPWLITRGREENAQRALCCCFDDELSPCENESSLALDLLVQTAIICSVCEYSTAKQIEFYG